MSNQNVLHRLIEQRRLSLVERVKSGYEQQIQLAKKKLSDAEKSISDGIKADLKAFLGKNKLETNFKDFTINFSDEPYEKNGYGCARHFHFHRKNNPTIYAHKKSVDVVCKAQDKAIQKVNERARKANEQLMLHGRTPEVVKMIEELV